MGNLKLALVAQDFPPTQGGIQTYSAELARHWAPACADFCVIAPHAQGAAQLPYAVRRVPGPHATFAANSALELARLGPDWLTFHTLWYSAGAAQALRAVQRLGPVFIAVHGRELLLEPWPRWAQPAYNRARQRVLQQADAVYAVSQFTADLALKLGVNPVHLEVHLNGTDPGVFLPAADRAGLRARHGAGPELIFLCVARLVTRKGVATTLHALSNVLKLGVSAQLWVVGNGPQKPDLQRLATELGIASQTRFLGGVPQAALLEYYQLADVFVLPTQSAGADVEGFGLVFLEANASGLPVIGPNVGGPAEAILDGVTGLCVDPNSVPALTEAMLQLAKNADLRALLGAQGRTRVVQQLNWKRVAERLLTSLTEQANSHLKY
jgi:phosphatidyl-myo-inositol dimannoside synthase